MVISEIMYRPALRPDQRNLEYVELYNSNPFPEDLSGFSLTGDINFYFADDVTIPGHGFLVIAAVPADVQSFYGLTNVLGPYFPELPNGSGRIQLRNALYAVLLDIRYTDEPPWPISADGDGHSLVLARPSLGEQSPASWEASVDDGGSPGTNEMADTNALRFVVINEILANSSLPNIDYIELYNRGTQAVDISGCSLSDNVRFKQFVFPSGSVIGPRDFIALDEFILGFALDADGETIYLRDRGNTRVIEVLRFGSQATSVAWGRVPDGGKEFRELDSLTPWAPNSAPLERDIVISEIMFAPFSGDSDDEYLELHNRGTAPQNLTGWQLVAGITFIFPSQTILPPGGYLVVARNAARLRSRYPNLTSANTVGDYDGNLSDSGERILLESVTRSLSTNLQNVITTNLVYSVADEVTFGAGGPWGRWSRSAGSSLELIDAREDNQRAANWADSDELSKSMWTSLAVTGPLEHFDYSPGSNVHLQIILPATAEVLIDDLEVRVGEGPNLLKNPGFEDGLRGWTRSGSHSFSGLENSGASGTSSLRLRAATGGDQGINNVRSADFATAINAGDVVTIRARARWIAGEPRLLLRLRGNGLDLLSQLPVPARLGSPGAPNSRALTNNPPAIWDVQHKPVLPRLQEPVVITARLQDSDGLLSPQLHYRIDPNETYLSLPLRDDGMNRDEAAGDGLYTAVIPGQPDGAMIAYYLEVGDGLGSTRFFPEEALTRRFPIDSPRRECLVRVGEVTPPGNFGTYRLWLSAATSNLWTTRSPFDGALLDATFVYNSDRVVYGVAARNTGHPWELASCQGPTGSNRCDYEVTFPSHDAFLGAHDFQWAVISHPNGPGSSDLSALADQLGNYFLRTLRLPHTHHRYIHVYVNGSQRSSIPGRPGNFIMEDTQPFDHDFAALWYDDADARGDLFAARAWAELNSNATSYQLHDAQLVRYSNGLNPSGPPATAPYHAAFPQLSHDPNDPGRGDSNLWRLIDAFSPAFDPQSRVISPELLEAIIDPGQWIRTLAVQHLIGNWLSYGYRLGANSYLYKPQGGRFQLLPGELDLSFGIEGSDSANHPLFDTSDPRIEALLNTRSFIRSYLQQFRRLTDGPFSNAQLDPWIDARASALVANGVNIDLKAVQNIKGFIAARSSYVRSELDQLDAPFEIFEETFITSDHNLFTIHGTAPLSLDDVSLYFGVYELTWTSITEWTMRILLPRYSTPFAIAAIDSFGNSDNWPGYFEYTGPPADPWNFVVINEIMSDPARPDEAFIEIHNSHPTASFHLNEHYLAGVDVAFPGAIIISNNQYLIVAKDRDAFAAAYGPSIPVAAEFPRPLDPNGGVLRLFDRLFIIRTDIVRYSKEPPWPAPAPGESWQVIDPSADNSRVADWLAGPATPGRANLRPEKLQYDRLTLSEVQPHNTLLADPFGEFDPWIEIHYPADQPPMVLTNFYLTDNYDHLTKWPLPPIQVHAGQFTLIWCDGQPGQSSDGDVHSGLRLNSAAGPVALVQLVNGRPFILDYVNYSNTVPNRSFALYPDGQVIYRTPDQPPTPASYSLPPRVVINEWMASNDRTIRDPADDNSDDWLELYNPHPVQVDISRFFIGDDNRSSHMPEGTVMEPFGFLLVWADREDYEQNRPFRTDVHAGFRIAVESDYLSLRTPGSDNIIDEVWFRQQLTDVSQGRFPDGGRDKGFLVMPTPRGPNASSRTNYPPSFTVTPNLHVILGVPGEAYLAGTDPDYPPQDLFFDLLPPIPDGAAINPYGYLTWTPQASHRPGTNYVTVRLSDTANPPLTATTVVQVVVRPLPAMKLPTITADGNFDFEFEVQPGLWYWLESTATLSPSEWITDSGGPQWAYYPKIRFQTGHYPRQRFYRLGISWQYPQF